MRQQASDLNIAIKQQQRNSEALGKKMKEEFPAPFSTVDR